jgi:hypothetical protein
VPPRDGRGGEVRGGTVNANLPYVSNKGEVCQWTTGAKKTMTW